MFEWDREPDAINEIGTKFWLDKHTTKYCHDKLGTNYWVYIMETTDGKKTRGLIEGNTKIIYENSNLEAFSCHIDILSLSRKYEKRDNRNRRKQSRL